MNRKTNLLWALAVMALLSATNLASAYYDPGAQRWINRDPIGEHGFEAIEGRKASLLAGDLNRFRFARNAPLDFFDPFGLKSTTLRCEAADEKRIRDTLQAACQNFESPTQCQIECLRSSLGPDPSGGDPAGVARRLWG